ncbi:hypothetical protein V8E55_004421, partial [Tylopilus felleus]
MRTRNTSSLLALDDAASCMSRHTNARPAKRRKVAGLNMRFDRMINSVNTMLSYRNSSPARKRMQSSGTSSVSSHDIPKTPVDDHGSLYPGKPSKTFSVLKFKKPLLLPQSDSDRFSKPAVCAPPKEPRDPLPDWLADTFCSLEADHPLRGLLSPSRINTELICKSNSPSMTLLGASREEEVKVFAFSPFDKEEEAPDAAYRADSTLNVRGPVPSVVSTGPSLSHPQFEISTTDPLPFSTPGCFAPARRSQSSIVDAKLQKRLIPEPQQMASMMDLPASPPSHLRRDDVIGQPRITQVSSNLVQDNGPPSDLQEHGANMNRRYQGFPGSNVYVTPGPTIACSRPVYFDSPTEDPSLSDPLQPESYELNLEAIDFRWRPFLRSNAPESNMNRHTVSPSSPPGHAVPNPDMVGDQSGWNARFAVDRAEHGTSNEDLPILSEDVDIAYLDDMGAVRPSNVNTTKSSTISNAIGPWSSPINDVPYMQARHICNLWSIDVICSKLHGHDMKAIGSGVHGIRPSTPIRPAPVSPPSTPQKPRSSQLCEMPRAPFRKTYSALSWMIPLKPSKRTTGGRDDVDRHLPHVFENSHDSIESW